MNAEKIATLRLSIGRNRLYQSIIQKQSVVDNAQELAGIYAAHNCELGQDIILLNSGEPVSAKSISTGIARNGEVSWVVTALGSSIPVTDRMPR